MTVQACDARGGKLFGEPVAGRAEILDAAGTERVRGLIIAKYGIAGRITVLGSVNTPRSVPFRAGMRLTEALAKSGGANPDADQGDVRIVRGSLSRPRVYTTSLRDLMGGRGTDVNQAQRHVAHTGLVGGPADRRVGGGRAVAANDDLGRGCVRHRHLQVPTARLAIPPTTIPAATAARQ